MLTPYPNTFPQEGLIMMLDMVRGKSVSVPELIHACWNVVGYGLSQTLGGGQIVAGEIEAFSKMTDEEILESALKQYGAFDSNSVAAVGLVPWVLLTKMAIKIIAKILA